jgi:hypothetical protein
MDSKVNLSTIIHILSLIRKSKTYDIDKLLFRLNLDIDKLIYSLTVLSEIYSTDGENFLDFSINSEDNSISFEYNESLLKMEMITDLDLFKMYTLLSNPKINIKNLFDDNTEINHFLEILNIYFESQYSTQEDNSNLVTLFNSDELYIEYIKLGSTQASTYRIKPLSLSTGIDGELLEAFDYVDEKIKTFILERIVNLPDENASKKTHSTTDKSTEITFLDRSGNKSIKKFRSQQIAVEYFLKNIDNQKIITPNSVKVEVEKRIDKLIKELKI